MWLGWEEGLLEEEDGEKWWKKKNTLSSEAGVTGEYTQSSFFSVLFHRKALSRDNQAKLRILNVIKYNTVV